MRLIDADVIEHLMKRQDWNTPDERWRPESHFGYIIDCVPTVEAIPVDWLEDWLKKNAPRWEGIKEFEHVDFFGMINDWRHDAKNN